MRKEFEKKIIVGRQIEIKPIKIKGVSFITIADSRATQILRTGNTIFINCLLHIYDFETAKSRFHDNLFIGCNLVFRFEMDTRLLDVFGSKEKIIRLLEEGSNIMTGVEYEIEEGPTFISRKISS